MSDAINPDHYKRLPAEAIEIIESAIEGAPTSQEAYLQGQALKYLLRANHKNGREDIYKAKWYLDRMVASFTVASDLLDHPSWTPEVEPAEQPAIKQSSTTEPPDGWRWLEVGEVIRKGDRYFKDHEWIAYDLWVGGKISESDRPSIRRNRFEVGERWCGFSTALSIKSFAYLAWAINWSLSFVRKLFCMEKTLHPTSRTQSDNIYNPRRCTRAA